MADDLRGFKHHSVKENRWLRVEKRGDDTWYRLYRLNEHRAPGSEGLDRLTEIGSARWGEGWIKCEAPDGSEITGDGTHEFTMLLHNAHEDGLI